MSNNNFPQRQNQKLTRPVGSNVPGGETQNQSATEFVPSPDEVARRAYFCYVNEGSKPGRDVQHWLKAEKELTDERNRTRAHAYHN